MVQDVRPVVLLVASMAPVAVIAAAGGMRIALLALVASGAVLVTRMRFAAGLAASVLVLAAMLTVLGPPPESGRERDSHVVRVEAR